MNLIGRLESAGIDIRNTGKTDEIVIQCPTCNRWKLYVNGEKKSWICFYCDTGGGTHGLLKLLGLKHEEDAASEFARLRTKMRGKVATAVPVQKTGHALPPGFLFLRENSQDTLFAQPYWDYLRARGVTDKMTEHWSLGYCVGGQLAGHLVMPITNLAGEIISFQSRPVACKSALKTYNPPGDAGLLFNLNYAKGVPGLVIVEGPFDAMAVHWKMVEQRTPVSAVALMGTGISEESASIIGRILRPSIAWVMLDPDMSEDRMHRIGSFLIRNGVSDVRVAKAPSDPDELAFYDLVDVLERAAPARRVEI